MIAIVAHANNLVIGKDNNLPWNVPQDMKHFVRITKLYKNVLFGGNTYKSLGGRELKERELLVLSKSLQKLPDATVVSCLEQVLTFSHDNDLVVAGGEMIYKQFFPFVNKLYVTEIDLDVEGDTFFPEYRFDFKRIEVIEEGEGYKISVWERK